MYAPFFPSAPSPLPFLLELITFATYFPSWSASVIHLLVNRIQAPRPPLPTVFNLPFLPASINFLVSPFLSETVSVSHWATFSHNFLIPFLLLSSFAPLALARLPSPCSSCSDYYFNMCLVSFMSSPASPCSPLCCPRSFVLSSRSLSTSFISFSLVSPYVHS